MVPNMPFRQRHPAWRDRSRRNFFRSTACKNSNPLHDVLLNGNFLASLTLRGQKSLCLLGGAPARGIVGGGSHGGRRIFGLVLRSRAAQFNDDQTSFPPSVKFPRRFFLGYVSFIIPLLCFLKSKSPKNPFI